MSERFIKPVSLALIAAFAAGTLSPSWAEELAPATQAEARLPDFSKLVEENGKGVVNISTVQKAKVTALQGIPGLSREEAEIFRRFGFPFQFGPREQQTPERHGTGSGFIVSSDGIILTNAHVVEGADELTVRLNDNREFPGKILGLDKKTDIAVVKIEATDLPALRIGSSEKLKVGEWVAAIGSPFGLENTVTAGIVSAKSRGLPSDRQYVPFIQTDVAVNPGNSGGPLFNMRGEVVGINSQIFSTSGGFMGLSFSIPIDLAIQIKDQLVADGHVTRGRIGVGIQSVNQSLAEAFGMKTPHGAAVTMVEKDGPAAKAKIREGDIITAVNGQKVRSANELPIKIASVKPGTAVTLTVLREGKELRVPVTVEAAKDDGDSPAATKAADPVKHGKLGIATKDLSAEELKKLELDSGVLVTDVRDPAKRAGVRPNDIIVSANGRPVKNTKALAALVKQSSKVALLVQRGQARLFIAVNIK